METTYDVQIDSSRDTALQLQVPSFQVQDFFVVWLDVSVSERENEDCQLTINTLKRVVHTINTFGDVNSCISYIMNMQNKKLLMIVSGSLGKTTVPIVHDLSHLTSIYIFCRDKSKHEHWARQWHKIKGVFTDILPICYELEQIMQQRDQQSIPISFIAISKETSVQELDHLDQLFIYTKQLKELLIDTASIKRPLKEFIACCRAEFANNEKELNMIDQFERKYSQHSPIWWYTRQCFLYPMLSRSIRMMDIDVIIKMGFFMRDLHQQIERLHQKQHRERLRLQTFIVYRGQGLSKSELDKTIATQGGFISFDSFLSSSQKRDVAVIYAIRAVKDFDLIGIVFKMIIDSSISPVPFAILDDVSFYKGSEQEILFSMHTIFRIGEIRRIHDNNTQMWEVELTLIGDNDQQLKALNKLIRENLSGTNEWYHVGHFLLKLDKFDRAEDLYKTLLSQTSDDNLKSYIYRQLGWIKDNRGKYDEAISFYKKSLEIDGKIFGTYNLTLAVSYDRIGLVYDKMGKYDEALAFHEKALRIYQDTLTPNHLDIATSFNRIGLLQDKLGNSSRALLSLEKALEIYKKILPPNDSSLAASNYNIGLLYDKLDDYSTALWFFNRALEIYKVTLPSNHSDVAACYQNIGLALEKMGEYAKVLHFYEKALKIFQTNLPSNHPQLAVCYSLIASVYRNMNQHMKAISFYEKALDIHQRSLVPNHYDRLISNKSIGDLYESIGDQARALVHYQRAFHICQEHFKTNDYLLDLLSRKVGNSNNRSERL